MTTVSPTPFAVSSFANNGRNPRARQATRTQPARPPLHRHSPLSSLGHSQGFSADAPMLQSISIGDSSDDDIPKPMNFSALTKAILENDAPIKSRSSPSNRYQDTGVKSSRQEAENRDPAMGRITPARQPLRIKRLSEGQQSNPGSPQRIVRLSESRQTSGSNSSFKQEALGSAQPDDRVHRSTSELITPGPGVRRKASIKSHMNSAPSVESHRVQSGSASQSSGRSSSSHKETNTSAPEQQPIPQVSSTSNDGSGLERSRTNNEAVPSTMRVKRVPIGSGTFLRGAPMRRGVRRAYSDDAASPADEELRSARQQNYDQQDKDGESPPPTGEKLDGRVESDPYGDNKEISSMKRARAERYTKRSSMHGQDGSPSESSKEEGARSTRLNPAQPFYKVPDLQPLCSVHDQENEPPPTFKRNKAKGSDMLNANKQFSMDHEPPSKMLATTRTASPHERQPLAQLNQNTPMRPAPPPPKMSVLETATATAGASTVKSKKKRSHVTVNGKMFTLRGRLGKGGSSDVYKVMAENDKMFALKKVNLTDCNEDTVRGYKGEIQLLKALENNDRVVRLFDYEINEQKQSLSVLMEMGESDLNRILGARMQPENSRLDLSFVRHYWREMVSCVQAVHDHDIVHSDLKPANFLLVQGRLKLIDFGIANAIDTDNTVNVHRETNVGTPNYMSPESLQDSNAGSGRTRGEPKIMKLGKPSDVWSLGCILYQMTYGRPPFAHIANQWNRVMAIINHEISISYPTKGIGDVFVPSSLRRLLQRCLIREPGKRPTVEQLLDDREAFLNPDLQAEGAVPMTEELLGQVLQKVVDRCRDPRRGFPSDDDLRGYPGAFLGQIRAGLERA